MAEIGMIKRVKYAGDVHAELLKAGWDLDTATAFVNNIPDADVAPVRHGRWQGSSGDTCPVCGEECFDWSNMRAFLYPYCPYCGTKMDGGASGGTESL